MPVVTNLGPHIQTGHIENIPFRAHFVAECRRTGWLRFLSERWTGSIDRDSHGRVRTQFARNGRLVATTITDPVTGLLTIRDERSGIVQRLKCPAPGAAGRLTPPTGAEAQTIEGNACFRITLPGIVDEAWISEELQYVLQEQSHTARQTTLWRMHGIQRVEPPAALFQPLTENHPPPPAIYSPPCPKSPAPPNSSTPSSSAPAPPAAGPPRNSPKPA